MSWRATMPARTEAGGHGRRHAPYDGIAQPR